MSKYQRKGTCKNLHAHKCHLAFTYTKPVLDPRWPINRHTSETFSNIRTLTHKDNWCQLQGQIQVAVHVLMEMVRAVLAGRRGCECSQAGRSEQQAGPTAGREAEGMHQIAPWLLLPLLAEQQRENYEMCRDKEKEKIHHAQPTPSFPEKLLASKKKQAEATRSCSVREGNARCLLLFYRSGSDTAPHAFCFLQIQRKPLFARLSSNIFCALW